MEKLVKLFTIALVLGFLVGCYGENGTNSIKNSCEVGTANCDSNNSTGNGDGDTDGGDDNGGNTGGGDEDGGDGDNTGGDTNGGNGDEDGGNGNGGNTGGGNGDGGNTGGGDEDGGDGDNTGGDTNGGNGNGGNTGGGDEDGGDGDEDDTTNKQDLETIKKNDFAVIKDFFKLYQDSDTLQSSNSEIRFFRIYSISSDFESNFENGFIDFLLNNKTYSKTNDKTIFLKSQTLPEVNAIIIYSEESFRSFLISTDHNEFTIEDFNSQFDFISANLNTSTIQRIYPLSVIDSSADIFKVYAKSLEDSGFNCSSSDVISTYNCQKSVEGLTYRWVRSGDAEIFSLIYDF